MVFSLSRYRISKGENEQNRVGNCISVNSLGIVERKRGEVRYGINMADNVFDLVCFAKEQINISFCPLAEGKRHYTCCKTMAYMPSGCSSEEASQ